jgi:S-adenosylmethionine hydrolase
VQFVDDFGNIITNIPASKVKSRPVWASFTGRAAHPIPWVKTYGDAAPGKLICLFSSDGFFEVAEVNGSAARRLGVEAGACVEIHAEERV